MRMKLVYLTCTLLWLVMSALIGMSFVSRSVFNAEQSFNVFDTHLFEQIGQKLQANEVVLGSYAAFCAQATTGAGERAFARRLLSDNKQIVAMFRLDAMPGQSLNKTLAHVPAVPAVAGLQPAAVTVLQQLRQEAQQHPGRVVSRPIDQAGRVTNYLLLRTIDGPEHGVVAMVVNAQALIPVMGPLPLGGALRIWHQRSQPQGDWLLQRTTGNRSVLETVLFPRLNVVRQIGSPEQSLMVDVNWQLGLSEINLFECLMALGLSLTLLVIMLVGVSSYARFLEGSQERELRLFYMANHDRLTNLANRNLFYDRLHHAISRLNRNGRSLAVLFLDMDRFKPVNDTYGHAAGDRVLQIIAARLKLELRIEDTVARLGGDEFVVLLEDVESKDEVNQVVERLKLAVECPYEVDDHRIWLGVSIGVAYYPEDGVLIEELLQVADRKMYGEKNEPALAI
jgi:diguanylate cyclase (GGDEF)-like protein